MLKIPVVAVDPNKKDSKYKVPYHIVCLLLYSQFIAIAEAIRCNTEHIAAITILLVKLTVGNINQTQYEAIATQVNAKLSVKLLSIDLYLLFSSQTLTRYFQEAANRIVKEADSISNNPLGIPLDTKYHTPFVMKTPIKMYTAYKIPNKIELTFLLTI